MNDRERFVACLTGEKVDHPPFWLWWGPWGTTWRRWQREGMPARFQSYGDVRREFGGRAEPQVVPVAYGPCPNTGWQILEQTDDWYLFLDTWQILRRNFKNHESMSAFLRFPVRDRRDWEEYKARWLDPDHPDRLGGDWLDQCRRWMAEGAPIQLGRYPDCTVFGGVRWMLGDEECLLAFYDQPDLIRDMMNHLTDLYLHVFQRVVDAGVRVDVVHVWEDMCSRQGPLISPRHWEEFMGPCYRRIRGFAKARGIRLVSVDTDGRPDDIVPPMMRNGVTYLWPMEVAAGTDVNDYRRRWPHLALMGGIDKRALAHGPQAIDAELARIRPAMESGRYIPELDHGIPDDVSWENFCHYAAALRRMVAGE